jgi:hypothetical protein
MSMRWILLCSLLGCPLAAAPWHFASGAARTNLLELYSSEGCSSCPPAEAWMASLRDAPGLWRDFVPVTFHVAYWDRLGWKDRFASEQFTRRQYAYAAQWRSDSVYTPEFVANGEEWRGPQSLPPPSAKPAGVLTVDCAPDGRCRVRYEGMGDFEVSVVRLGAGIVSSVRAGENAGRILHHEFVALGVVTVPLVDGAAELTVPPAEVPGVTRQGLAVWLTRRGELTPVQAVGGWLD